MIFLYIILIIVVLCSIRLLPKGESWNADYISKDTTNVVKGICIWLVLYATSVVIWVIFHL